MLSHGYILPSRSIIFLYVPKLLFSVLVFKGIYSKTCKVVFYCDFDFPFAYDWEMKWDIFYVLTGQLHTFFIFLETIQVLSLFLSWDVWFCFFICSFVFVLVLEFLTHSEYISLLPDVLFTSIFCYSGSGLFTFLVKSFFSISDGF